MKKFILSFAAILLASVSIAYAQSSEDSSMKEIKIKITAKGKTLDAVLDDNATSRDLLSKMPFTVEMLDLYGREMCYHFPDALALASTRSDGYEVGDIAYWPPRHSLVILYEQNGERFSRVHLGKVKGDVSIFDNAGTTKVTFEEAEEK
ncbi:MAG: cyclophilin-like fold protein [Bacteroides sp.]|nr:cyclophilin-like fold protein [Prevotella sp.]MCM1408888.1 cyclophilin-like fold protein [Treponema brennaborense]MCM1470851.1 cyclophilin-like fold protein [Bacteroides sp.]